MPSQLMPSLSAVIRAVDDAVRDNVGKLSACIEAAHLCVPKDAHRLDQPNGLSCDVRWHFWLPLVCGIASIYRPKLGMAREKTQKRWNYRVRKNDSNIRWFALI